MKNNNKHDKPKCMVIKNSYVIDINVQCIHKIILNLEIKFIYIYIPHDFFVLPLPRLDDPARNWASTISNTLCNQDVHNRTYTQSGPSLPLWWLVLLTHTSVNHATDVNMLLRHHQLVLYHNDWLCISWSHCHGFVDKPSNSKFDKTLEEAGLDETET